MRLLSADAVHASSRLSQPHGQTCEVAVARHEEEDVHVSGVQQVHSIDGERGVRGVLAGDVRRLLHRLDGVQGQLTLPPAQVRARPVPVPSLDAQGPLLGGLGQDSAAQLPADVVAVDEDCHAIRICHLASQSVRRGI